MGANFGIDAGNRPAIPGRDVECITVGWRLETTAEPVGLDRGTGSVGEGQRSADSPSRDQECGRFAASGAGLRAVRHVVAWSGGVGADDRSGRAVGRGGSQSPARQRGLAARDRRRPAGAPSERLVGSGRPDHPLGRRHDDLRARQRPRRLATALRLRSETGAHCRLRADDSSRGRAPAAGQGGGGRHLVGRSNTPRATGCIMWCKAAPTSWCV